MRKRTFYKHFVFTLLTFALLFLTGCQNAAQVSSPTDSDFEAFTEALFQQEVSANTIGLHYTLENPEDYGILDAQVTYGSYSTSSVESSAALENCLAALRKYEGTSLSEENQLTYDVLEDYLETAMLSAEYTLYDEPLSTLTGVQAQLPILLSEFRLENTEDIDIYLTLLSATEEYFDSLINFQRTKSDAGLFMSDTNADCIIEECTSFIGMGKDNYLLSSFEERLDEIDSLTESDRSLYIKKNCELVEASVFTAYQNLIDAMQELRGTGTNDYGLSYYPNGDKYYEYVVRRETGSSRSISELLQLTETQMLTDLQAIQDVLSENPDAAEVSSQESPLLVEANPLNILDDLKTKMSSIFPDNPNVNNTIKYVSEDMQDYVSPAFYIIPAIDDTSENVIYINQGSTTDGIDLYTTLAHEGYPGHLYQTTYYAGLDTDPLRSALNFGGYVEGWATYAEMCSYYLSPLASDEAALLQHNASFILGLYALSDIGIHYQGWTLMDTVSFFSNYGITDTDTVTQIYNLIVSDPGNYLKYYIGYLEFLELKKEAISEWGDSFTQLRFHEAVLSVGPASFNVIRNHIFSE